VYIVFCRVDYPFKLYQPLRPSLPTTILHVNSSYAHTMEAFCGIFRAQSMFSYMSKPSHYQKSTDQCNL
jgi:hypothetical protein